MWLPSLGLGAIRIAIGWTILGIVAFLISARTEHVWPFGPKKIREEFLTPDLANAQPETTS